MTSFIEGGSGSKQYQHILNKDISGFKHDSSQHISHEALPSISTIGSTRLNNVLKIDQVPDQSIFLKSDLVY